MREKNSATTKVSRRALVGAVALGVSDAWAQLTNLERSRHCVSSNCAPNTGGETTQAVGRPRNA